MYKCFVTLLLLCEMATTVSGQQIKSGEHYDLMIRGGRIVDGTGAPWYEADIGIVAGKISRIGRLNAEFAAEVVEARGLIVAPGFVDMMGQTASPMIDNPASALNLLTQGITTINAGEGDSAAPLSEAEGARHGFTTLAEYFTLLDLKGLPVNVVQTIGHTRVRQLVLGDVDRRPTQDELSRMQAYVREAMEAGAIGVSTALIYPPAVYAQTEEIAALVKVAGEYGGRYYTHMRNEGDQLLEAIDEALEIGRVGNAPVHIFHLKAAGEQNWPKFALALAKIKAARAAGHAVSADIYPYVNNGLSISALIHPRHFAKGRDDLIARLDDSSLQREIRREMESTDGWENWFRHAGQDWNRIVIGRSNDDRYATYNGSTVAQVAEATGEDAWKLFFNLVKSDAFVLPQTMSEANLLLAMREPYVSFCTDVGPAGNNLIAGHPRAFGAFPRLLSHYVKGLGVIPLEQFVAQASAVAANEIMAYDRGRISVGLAADIIAFDYALVKDKADFKNPRALAEGMKYVVVGGQVVLKDGAMTTARPGRVLRGPGFRTASAAYELSSGDEDKHFSHYDAMLRDFLREHRVPGISIAVSHAGKIAFAKGYGYADVALRQPVTTESLFRIASISKPITAVAVLQLIEQGKLGLEDRVLDVLPLAQAIERAGDRFDGRWRDITIRHLLEHRGGWDRELSFDPMFNPVEFAQQIGVEPPADQATVIEAMLRHKLDFDPGQRSAYSNFGYCLLGRVVEQLSGQSYEQYVQQKVLQPLGITNMRIGATRLMGRVPNEVRYYQPGTGQSVFASDLHSSVPVPYGAWNLEAMDSHGGWIASATDLAKFACALDDPNHCPILKAESIALMHARPDGLAGYEADGQPRDVYYSLGWMNRVLNADRVNHWHTGSLAGTATVLIRRHDGKNFVALMNSRVSPSSEHLGREIDRLLHDMANAVRHWPE